MNSKGGSSPRDNREPAIRGAFARALADLRTRAGLTQEQVADKSGYEDKYISALERRKHTPTLTAVIQISYALNVTPLEMLRLVLELLPKFENNNQA